MGAACSVGTMGKISSDDHSLNNNNNNNNNNKLKTVRSFGRLMKKKKKYENECDETPKIVNSPLRFDSDNIRLSFSWDFPHPPTSSHHNTKVGGQKGSSFIGRASFAGLEKAVDVIDALGSGMTNLNNSGFLSGKMTKGNKIYILAFEVANTITHGANLMNSLSKENVRFIKQDIIPSQGVQSLVSTVVKVLLGLAASDKREELDVFCKEVIRFGNLCKDAQWHNLERFFAKLDSENAAYRQERDQADAKLQELMFLVQHTSELYHELNIFDRFEQDYRQKVEEMKSLNLPRKGEHLMMLQSELRQQKKIVSGLKKKSLWSRKLEEIVEKLVDIVAFIHQEITEAFETGGFKAGEKVDTGAQSLGTAGLSLHYANIINQLDNIASKPTSLPSNIRDTLYRGLPPNVKATLRSSLRKLNPVDEVDVPQVKAEIEVILQWLAPVAANTLKAHQGFGWVGEWANASIEFNKKTEGNGNLIRLQTLYHADKERTDFYILKLVTLLHQLINGIKQRDYGLRTLPLSSPTKTIMVVTSSTKTNLSSYGDTDRTPKVELSEDDRELLENFSKRSFVPGISKSQEFSKPTPRTTKCWKCSSKSMECLPYGDPSRTCPEIIDDNDLEFAGDSQEAPF